MWHVQVRLTCVAAAPGAKMGDKSTSLPRSTQLQAVRLLCEKLFKVTFPSDLLHDCVALGKAAQDMLHK